MVVWAYSPTVGLFNSLNKSKNMVIEKILYKKTFNLGNYSTHTIGVEIGLDAGEDAKLALQTAHDLAHEYHKESFDGYGHEHIEVRMIPDIQVEKNNIAVDYDTVIDEINKCETIAELDGWNIISKGNHKAGIAFARRAAKILSPKT